MTQARSVGWQTPSPWANRQAPAWRAHHGRYRHLPTAAKAAAERAGGRIALLWRDSEPGFQSAAALSWKKRLRGISAQNVEATLTPLRMIKDGEEIERIRQAIKITEKTLKNIFATLPSLRTEQQVAARLVSGYIEPHYGHLAFPPIVGGGIKALPCTIAIMMRPLAKKTPY